MAETKPETYEHRRYGLGRTIDRHDQPDTPQLERVQRWLLRYGIEHLHGPREIAYDTDELVVLCLLRNGRPYIESFIEHYLALGAKHLVFLDNGSTDGTVEALREYEAVTVLRSSLPYQRYQVLMKRYLIERFGRGRWSLYVDIDELFDYPYSDVVDLRSLLGYLNERGYTAVVSYMLDMFPGEPLSEVSENGAGLSLKEVYRFYETSGLLHESYRSAEGTGNVVSNEDIDILQGGVQRRVFDTAPLLMKHPLIFLDERVKPMDLGDHWAGNARVADFTGVLFHYKLTGNLYGSVRREMEEGRYVNRRGKYRKYSRVLKRNPRLLIRGEHSRELRSVNDLLGTPFAVVSGVYLKLAAHRGRESPDQTHDATDAMQDALLRAQTEISAHARQTERLRQENRRLRQEIGENERSATRARSLEQQLQAVQSSRAWKVLRAISYLKRALLRRSS